MATIYLDLTSGNDSNDGLTIGAPKLTLVASANAADDGGTVILLDGTYNIGANLKSTFSKDITFRSQSGDPSLCIINGGVNEYLYTVDPSANHTVDMSGIQFQNMFITTQNALVLGGSGETLTVSTCIFYKVRSTSSLRFIVGQTSLNPNITVTSCLFDNCANSNSNSALVGAGTSGATGGNIIVRNCTVISSPATPAKFCFNVGGAGAVSLSVKNTIQYHDDAFASTFFNAPSAGDNICSNNDTFTTGGAISITNADTEENNITDDPLFVDLANQDYRLRPDSPCVDTGSVL